MHNELMKRSKEIADFLVQVAASKRQTRNAEQVYRWALDLDPENAGAIARLGSIYASRREFAEALECFETAAGYGPSVDAYLNCAMALMNLGRFDEAAEWCHKALRASPSPGKLAAWRMLVTVQIEEDCEDEALETIAEALGHYPGDSNLQFARSTILLRRGQFEQGWKDYDHRPPRLELAHKLVEYPEWQGEHLNGKTLLVCGEQGLGDQIQFARYLTGLLEFGGRIVLRTLPELARLFSATPGMPKHIVTSDRELEDLDIDCWIGICSLPRYVKDPRACQYLWHPHSESPRVVLPDDGKLRVGICWAGNPVHARDAQRSLPYASLGPLLDLAGVTTYALQHGPASAQNDGRAIDIDDRCYDLAELAAVMSQLDIVITVDTAIAHLAGALGIETWVLVYKPGDWRWGSDSSRTHLYPDMRLFRQTEAGDWDSVIERVRKCLAIAAVDAHAICRGPIPEDSNPIRMAEGRYGKMSCFAGDRWLGRALELYGEWSQSEVELFRDILKPGDVVVEAGANIGALTVPLAQIVGVDGRVFAFEPEPRNFKLLHENVVRNCPCVTMAPAALGRSNGPASIKTMDGNPGGTSIDPGTFHGPTCSVFSLDTLAYPDGPTAFEILRDRLDFMKIDVEGMELDVLEGAKETIARFRPLIYAENDRPGSTEQLTDWLERAGYRVYQHFAPLYNPLNFSGYTVNVFGKIVSAMLFAIPRERFGFDRLIQKHRMDRIRIKR